MKNCNLCGKLFTQRDYCTKCNCLKTIERQQRFKRACFALKGGVCERCGISTSTLCYAAFTFQRPAGSPAGEHVSRLYAGVPLPPAVEDIVRASTLLCSNCARANARVPRWKRQCIDYLGGVCERCGSTCTHALDFHHRDPSRKDFEIGSGERRTFIALRAELDECELVCSNCHACHHYYLKALDRAEYIRSNGIEGVIID